MQVWHENRRLVNWFFLTLARLPKYAIGIMNGKVYLVGIGSGNRDDMTYGAAAALKKAEVIIGQKSCIDLLWKSVVGKEVIAADMSPVERSKTAVDIALTGRDAAIVSTGDSGIYAIASTFFGYLKDKNIALDVDVVPGLTLAGIAAARLGSPLGHDFAVISLADQATGWESIKKRLKAAAEADFVTVLYNPVGKLGYQRLKEAVSILLEKRQEIGYACGCRYCSCHQPGKSVYNHAGRSLRLPLDRYGHAADNRQLGDLRLQQ